MILAYFSFLLLFLYTLLMLQLCDDLVRWMAQFCEQFDESARMGEAKTSSFVVGTNAH